MSELPLSMALPDLRVDLYFGESPARQIEVEQFGDVTSAKQWKFSAGTLHGYFLIMPYAVGAMPVKFEESFHRSDTHRIGHS
jgi:hypothetical protein